MDSGTYVPLGRDGTGEATVIDTTPLIKLALQRQNSADRYKAAQAKAQGDADKQLLDQAKTLSQGNHGIMATLSNPHQDRIVNEVQQGLAKGTINGKGIASAQMTLAGVQSRDDAANELYKGYVDAIQKNGGNADAFTNRFLQSQIDHHRQGNARQDFDETTMMHDAFRNSLTESDATNAYLSHRAGGGDKPGLTAFSYTPQNSKVGPYGSVKESSLSLFLPRLVKDKDGRVIDYYKRTSNGRQRYDIDPQRVLDYERSNPDYAAAMITPNLEASRKELETEHPGVTPTDLEIKTNAFELALHHKGVELGAGSVKDGYHYNPTPPNGSGKTAAQKNSQIILTPTKVNDKSIAQGSTSDRRVFPSGGAYVPRTAGGKDLTVGQINSTVYAVKGATTVPIDVRNATKFVVGPIRPMYVADPESGPVPEKPNPNYVKDISDAYNKAKTARAEYNKHKDPELKKVLEYAQEKYLQVKESKYVPYNAGEPILAQPKSFYGRINPATGAPYGMRRALVVSLSPSINSVAEFTSESQGQNDMGDFNNTTTSERPIKSFGTVYAPLDQVPEVEGLFTPEQKQKLMADMDKHLANGGHATMLRNYNIGNGTPARQAATAPAKVEPVKAHPEPKPAARTAAPAPAQPQPTQALPAKAKAISDKLKNYNP